MADYRSVSLKSPFPPCYCTVCGAMIADTELHDEWHKKEGK